MTNSLISLGRWVGAALATASTSLILSTSGPRDPPTESDFRTAFAIGVVLGVAVCLAALLLVHGRRAPARLDTGPGARFMPTPLAALPPLIGDLPTDVLLVAENVPAVVAQRKQECRD